MSRLKRPKGSNTVEQGGKTTAIRTDKDTAAVVPAGPVDEIDRAIIRLLQRDGRSSNTEIGRALDLTEATIRKRIGRLVSDNLVNIVAVPRRTRSE